jgi:hypothetical protein
MEYREFDRMVRAMTTGVSRRSMLRRAAGSAIASPRTLVGLNVARADGKKDNKDKDKDKDKDKGRNRGSNSNVDTSGGVAFAAACGEVGNPCARSQDCCGGLECHATALRCVPGAAGVATGQTQANQTVVNTNNQVCAGDCVQTNQQVVTMDASQTTLASTQEFFGAPPSYWIDVACTFDAPLYRTICNCTGRGASGAPPIRKITLSPADICAFVISEETLVDRVQEQPREVTNVATGGEANAGTGGVANADASGGSVTIGDVRGEDNNIAIDASGGTANADASGGDNNVAIAGGGQVTNEATQVVELSTLVLELEGNVVPGRQTTYWVDTDSGRRPATGPALVQVADEPADAGVIIAEAKMCSIPQPQQGYDWFGQCTAPVTGMSFSVYPESGGTAPLATVQTNAQGRARFGNLPPGTYQVKPEGALGTEGMIWCYAESDRVDANGNIMVEADLESHIWSFTCNASG